MPDAFREYYDQLIARAADPWGLIIPGGSGTAATWAVADVHTAVHMLDTALTQMQAGDQAD